MTKLPLFSTVNGVMFPNTTQFFTIRRDFSIASVKEAVSNFNGQILIATQKSMSKEKPSIKDIHTTACICKITNLIELPDGEIKFSALAEGRFSVSDLTDQGTIRYGLGKAFALPSKTKEISAKAKDKIFERLRTIDLDLEDEEYEMLENLKTVEDDYNFAMYLGYFTAKTQMKHREMTIEEMNKGLSTLDVLSEEEKSSVNKGMATMIEILKSEDYKTSVQKMEKYLEAVRS